MTKDLSAVKQIEEMTSIIHKNMPIGLELSALLAANLYNEGFRKMCSERNAYGHADPVGEPGTEGEDGLSLNEIRANAVRSFAKWLIARPGNSIYCGDLPDLVLEYIEGGME